MSCIGISQPLAGKLLLFITTISLSLNTSQTIADTKAERAAQSERPLYKAEAERLEQSCPFPAPAAERLQLSGDMTADQIALPQLDLLPLLQFIQSPTPAAGQTVGHSQIHRYKDLPKGGIGARDVCQNITVWRFRPIPAGEPASTITQRLRPGLDLAAEYPAAYSAIQQAGQMLSLPSESYARLMIQTPDEATRLADTLAKDPAIDVNKPYLLVGQELFLPLR